MTLAFDTARAELVRHIEAIEHDAVTLQEQLGAMLCERDKLAARLEGMDDARRLLDEPAEQVDLAPQPERQRADVQGPVLRVLAQGPLTEVEISASTDLPVASIHAFLLRAVREDKVIRDGDLYRLPSGDNAGAKITEGLTEALEIARRRPHTAHDHQGQAQAEPTARCRTSRLRAVDRHLPRLRRRGAVPSDACPQSNRRRDSCAPRSTAEPSIFRSTS